MCIVSSEPLRVNLIPVRIRLLTPKGEIMRLQHLSLGAIAALCLLGLASQASARPALREPTEAAKASVTTIASGLDNPRDLAFSPNGKLYVAEAGHGGPVCVSGGPEGDFCPGFTSGLSVISGGQSHRVIDGLASFSDNPAGFGAVGLDGISFLGNGTLYGIMASARDVVPAGLAADVAAGLRAQLGRLIQANPSGHRKARADVGHTDFVWTQEHKDLVPDPNANPYGVLALPGAQWVVDAGSNTIDVVRPNGSVTVAAFVPPAPAGDSVPTCLDRGRDGALYVGELTGGGNPPGSARVWRFDPATRALSVWVSGLSTVTGCGFGKDGQFYAVEFSTLGLAHAAPGTGEVVRVPAHSTSPITVAGGLSFPGGFAAGRDGSLYVSNWSIAPAVTGLGSV